MSGLFLNFYQVDFPTKAKAKRLIFEEQVIAFQENKLIIKGKS
jgi:hypothetical protein